MTHALVIEDQNLISMAILDDLIDHGYLTVAIATSEAEAIALASQRCPSLITADDELASGTGVSAIREICKDKSLPVVFITAHADRILAAIPDAVIVLKPFAPHQLKAAIAAALQRPLSFSTGL